MISRARNGAAYGLAFLASVLVAFGIVGFELAERVRLENIEE